MIQLQNQKPTFLTEELTSLKQEWQRFTDGVVNFDELKEALRACFTCVVRTEIDDLDEEDGNEEKFAPMAKSIPQGRGALYILAK